MMVSPIHEGATIRALFMEKRRAVHPPLLIQ